MKQLLTVLPVIGLLMLVACSTSRNIFVLIPDPEGKVGEISIENEAGKQILSTEGAVVEVKDKQTLPKHRKSLTTHEIQAVFQDAISTIPGLSARYILYFKFGLTELTEQSKRYFNQVADRIIQIVNERKPCDIRVVGHTDTAGSDVLNLKLGLARARMVSQKLIHLGIPSDRLDVASHSEKDLRIPTPDATVEPRNRRVEIIVH